MMLLNIGRSWWNCCVSVSKHYQLTPIYLLTSSVSPFVCIVYILIDVWMWCQTAAVLHFQLKEIPDDFFVDIVSRNNFLTTTLQASVREPSASQSSRGSYWHSVPLTVVCTSAYHPNRSFSRTWSRIVHWTLVLSRKDFNLEKILQNGTTGISPLNLMSMPLPL